MLARLRPGGVPHQRGEQWHGDADAVSGAGPSAGGRGHSNDNNLISLANGKVLLSATVTVVDGDNDTATGTVSADLGGNIRFEDDVPSVTINAVADGGIT